MICFMHELRRYWLCSSVIKSVSLLLSRPIIGKLYNSDAKTMSSTVKNVKHCQMVSSACYIVSSEVK